MEKRTDGKCSQFCKLYVRTAEVLIPSAAVCFHTGALQIENSEETDQGKYECVASNNAGVRYSPPANLYVRGRERLITQHPLTRGCWALAEPKSINI